LNFLFSPEKGWWPHPGIPAYSMIVVGFSCRVEAAPSDGFLFSVDIDGKSAPLQVSDLLFFFVGHGLLFFFQDRRAF